MADSTSTSTSPRMRSTGRSSPGSSGSLRPRIAHEKLANRLLGGPILEEDRTYGFGDRHLEAEPPRVIAGGARRMHALGDVSQGVQHLRERPALREPDAHL